MVSRKLDPFIFIRILSCLEFELKVIFGRLILNQGLNCCSGRMIYLCSQVQTVGSVYVLISLKYFGCCYLPSMQLLLLIGFFAGFSVTLIHFCLSFSLILFYFQINFYLIFSNFQIFVDFAFLLYFYYQVIFKVIYFLID